MKRIFIILVFLVAAKTVKAQVPDTLAYLQSIVANKTQFIGQSFSRLADSLKIQIKFFSPFAAIHYDKKKETSTSFVFYFPQSTADHYLSYPRLEVYWLPYLNAEQSDSLWENNDGGGWSPAVASFYSNGIIADIKVVE